MIDELITLEEYNPKWSDVFEVEKQKVYEAFEEIKIEVAHIGSTSIIGMKAKPIIDIMIGVYSLLTDNEINKAVEKLGYENFGEISPGRIYCRKRQEYYFNLAIVVFQGEIWDNNICFRDYLRSHPDDVVRYSELKNETISKGINMLLAYSDEKAGLISELMRKAKT